MISKNIIHITLIQVKSLGQEYKEENLANVNLLLGQNSQMVTRKVMHNTMQESVTDAVDLVIYRSTVAVIHKGQILVEAQTMSQEKGTISTIIVMLVVQARMTMVIITPFMQSLWQPKGIVVKQVMVKLIGYLTVGAQTTS